MGFLLLVSILGIVGLGSGLAWGPGNHLVFARRVYGNRRRFLPAKRADLLRRARAAYYYGNIAADIINFKAWGGHKNHCHRWTIVDDMRARARTDSQQAFVYGYLAHLAADTIAHNHFVPYHLTRYARSKGLGHLYWELRADRFVPESTWKLIASLKQDSTLDELDDLVNDSVPKKALSMRANKLLFNHVLLIGERDAWRRQVGRLHERSNTPLDLKFLELFRQAAVGRIRLALSPGGRKKLQHIDTNGKDAQKHAWKTRLRILRRIASPRVRGQESEEAASLFLEGMESPPMNGGAPHWSA